MPNEYPRMKKVVRIADTPNHLSRENIGTGIFEFLIVGDDTTALSGNVIAIVRKGTFKVVDEDSAVGAMVEIHGKSTTPANDDVGGTLRFWAVDDGDNDTVIADIYATITDVTDGSETSNMIFTLQHNGSDVNVLGLLSQWVVFNCPTTAIADGSISNNNLAFHYDSGSTELVFKHKDGSGTVRTGAVKLT